MIRKLAFALSLLGVCFTGLVHALGLGEATVTSSLNQPLRAEIELVNTRNLELNEILPGLATREEFLKANVDRVYFLSDIRFKVESNKNGKMVVVLTTSKPVREPFINFLVEVIWPSGRLLREYALLIDPPLFNEDKAKPVQAPVTHQQASGDVVTIPQAAPAKSVGRTQANQGIAGQSYGPTNSKDTLWDIALKARPDRSVTPQQVMLSIQDLNPAAFINKNINKLKAGVVLRLPTLEQIRQRSGGQAIREVIAQNEALLPKRTQSVVSAAKKVPSRSSSSTVESGDELKLVVASSQSPEATSSASSGQSSGSGSGQTVTNKELAVTLEKLDKATIDNKELHGRVTDLEEQLQTLQRLLTLKNDQLATVQEQMRANELAALQVEKEQSEKAAAKPPVSTPKTDAQTGAEPVDAPAVVSEKSKPKQDQPAPQDLKTDNLIETIINNPLYLAILGLATLALLVLLWAISRSNARKEQEFHARSQDEDVDSIDATEAESDEDDDVFGSSEVAEIADSEESDIDDEPSVDRDGEAQDVIAEADVYVAYGRLDQAASILEEAISSEPVRTDYRLKLLDVYRESNDVDAFNRQFSELEAIQDEDAMAAATQIRNELLESDLMALDDKEHELAEHRDDELAISQGVEDASIELEQEAIESEEDESGALESDDKRTFDFDTVEESTDEELDIDFSSEELDLELDVDLDLDEGEPSELADDGDDLELDLSSLEPTEDSSNLSLEDDLTPEEEASLTGTDESSPDEDFGSELDDVDFSTQLDQENEIDLPEDLDLSEPPVEPQVEQQVEVERDAEAASETDEAPEQIISDDILDEAVEAFGETDDLEADLGDSEEFDFLDGADEASTKLDLARAYIDMGDIEGARDILEEVEKEGSDEQQSEAKALLSTLES